MIVVIGGVTGAGKTLIGRALAAELGWRFIDTDVHHSQENVRKMSNGIPLDEGDRDPWLSAINDELRELQRSGTNVVVACSALTRAHRAAVAAGLSHVRFVHLTAPAITVHGRLQARRGHFAGPELLRSQLAAIESSSDVVSVPNTAAVPVVVGRIRSLLRI